MIWKKRSKKHVIAVKIALVDVKKEKNVLVKKNAIATVKKNANVAKSANANVNAATVDVTAKRRNSHGRKTI